MGVLTQMVRAHTLETSPKHFYNQHTLSGKQVLRLDDRQDMFGWTHPGKGQTGILSQNADTTKMKYPANHKDQKCS